MAKKRPKRPRDPAQLAKLPGAIAAGEIEGNNPAWMRRREFLGLAAAAIFVPPATAGAQPARLPLIGFVRNSSVDDALQLVAAFRRGLGDTTRAAIADYEVIE